MSRLTEEDIREINNIDGWCQGIFKEPNWIPTSIKDYVVYQRYETGGMGGGSCWDDSDPSPYSTDERPNFDVLDAVLKKIAPDVSYLKYKEIEKRIVSKNETEYEYYGNSTDWEVKFIVLEDLYKLLGI
jgi:hypothetical protein